MRLILFDIDGTLLWTAGAGRRAIHRAMLDEVGTAGPIDGYRFDGKTDPQIVRELLTLAGHPEASSEDRVTAVCHRYVELLTAELEKPTQTTKIYPGITELLSALEGGRIVHPRFQLELVHRLIHDSNAPSTAWVSLRSRNTCVAPAARSAGTS